MIFLIDQHHLFLAKPSEYFKPLKKSEKDIYLFVNQETYRRTQYSRDAFAPLQVQGQVAKCQGDVPTPSLCKQDTLAVAQIETCYVDIPTRIGDFVEINT